MIKESLVEYHFGCQMTDCIFCQRTETDWLEYQNDNNYGTEMNASQFGVKTSKVKVTVE